MNRSPLRPLLVLAMWLAICTGLGGCGYKTGFATLKGVQTLWVPVFKNRTLRRENEYTLTQAVIRRLQAQTRVRIQFQAKNADASLFGEIINFTESVISEDSTDQTVESSIGVTVKIRLVDNRTGKVLLERTVANSESFIVSQSGSEDLARQRVFDDLAQEIIYALEAWE